MAKDALGHGSEKRGGVSADPHRQARMAIAMHPNDPNPQAEAVLRGLGYSPNDIGRLRANAGAQIAETPAAHQTGVQQALPPARDFTRVIVDPERLRKAAGVSHG